MLKTQWKKSLFWPICKEFVSFFNWELWVKKFVDSYTENSWKHVVSSIIDLIGVVRQTEKASQNFMPKNAENTNQWTSRDVEALASKLETLPIFIDAAHSSSVMNGPVAGQTRCSLPNDHLAYLITWYVFSWKYGWSISIISKVSNQKCSSFFLLVILHTA